MRFSTLVVQRRRVVLLDMRTSAGTQTRFSWTGKRHNQRSEDWFEKESLKLKRSEEAESAFAAAYRRWASPFRDMVIENELKLSSQFLRPEAVSQSGAVILACITDAGTLSQGPVGAGKRKRPRITPPYGWTGSE